MNRGGEDDLIAKAQAVREGRAGALPDLAGVFKSVGHDGQHHVALNPDIHGGREMKEQVAEFDALCIECGDHRGWTVAPDWNTGDAAQVQCRACSEHVCPGLRVWPPAEWCADISPDRLSICDQPRGHEGEHTGSEMPVVEIDE